MSQRRPRILFASSYEPQEQPDSGFMQRLATLYRGMQASGEVDLFFIKPQPVKPAGWSRPGDTTSAGVLMEAASNAAAWCQNLRRRRPAAGDNSEFLARRPEDYDVVFLHKLSSAWWTGWTDPKRCIVDVDDLPSHYFQQSALRGSLPLRLVKWLRYRRVRWSERRMPQAFRFVLVCSEDDRRYLDHPHVQVIPNGYWPHPGMAQASDQARHDQTLLFVGSLTFPPNVAGVAWFVKQVLPLVRQKMPDATLTVVGRTSKRRDGDWSWVDAPGVNFVGMVDDVAPYIQQSALEVCPLFLGRGTRIKILESLAFAKPVVSTAIGAYGLPLGEPQGIFRREDSQTFADACLALLNDPDRCRSLGVAGQHAVAQRFSPEAIQSQLAGLVDRIIAEAGYARDP